MTAHASPPGTSRRTMRGKLLVVGASPSVEQFVGVAQTCVGAVARARDLYDAIADISRSSDREPIAAVAVSSDCPDFEPAIVIEAIQAVDRSLPVFLLYPRGDEMSAIAIREGYEHAIPLPAIDEDVHDALAPVGLIADARDARASGQHPVEIDISTPDRTPTLVDSTVRRALASAHPESPMHATAAHAGVAHGGAAHDGAPHGSRRTEAVRAQASRDEQPKRRETPGERPARPYANPASGAQGATPARTPSAGNPADNGRTTHPPRPHASPRAADHAGSAPHHERNSGDSAGGDIALVRCLRRGKPLRETALVELRRAAELPDARLVPVSRPGEEEIVARERAGLTQVPVVGESGTHGILLSAAADAAKLQEWANWLAEWLDLEAIHLDYRRLSTTDQLTGALNRRAFEQLVPEILEEARERRRDVSLMYFDIDDFKRYNDDFGHAAGDEVLRESIDVLRESIRTGDLVFRLGGDEFVVLFCDPKPPRHGGSGVPESIKDIAERCRTAVRRLQVPLLADSGPGPVTISAGCAVFPWDANDAKALLELADTRALEAKKLGKDQINFGPERFPGAEGE